MVTRVWVLGKNVDSLFNGYGVLVQEDEKALEMGGDDGSTTKRMHLMLPNCTLKNVIYIKCICYIYFNTIKINKSPEITQVYAFVKTQQMHL